MNAALLTTVIRDNWTSLIHLHVSLLFLNPLKMNRTPPTEHYICKGLDILPLCQDICDLNEIHRIATQIFA